MDLKQILYYVRHSLNNPEAAKSIQKDAREVVHKLTYLAESLKLCEEPILAKRGYRVIFFQKHHYLMMYRVEGAVVYVDAIFHKLQDYQSLFK